MFSNEKSWGSFTKGVGEHPNSSTIGSIPIDWSFSYVQPGYKVSTRSHVATKNVDQLEVTNHKTWWQTNGDAWSPLLGDS